MKRCIFCKSDLAKVGRACEHIVPQWLQREWGFADELVEPTHFDEKGNVVSMRRHSLDSFLAGHVCAPCNNGWMSALETKCKDLILDLASGQKRILNLRDEEALLLARWTVKTSFVLHTASNWRRVVPEEHIFKLDSDSYRLPERVFVVGHTYKASTAFAWSQNTTWPIFTHGYDPSETDVQTAKAKGYKIGLRLGGLFVMVFYNPLPFARPCLWKYRHVPLYPRWSHPVAWQMQDRAWPKKAEFRFHAFMLTLSLSIDSSEQDGVANRSQPTPSKANPASLTAGSDR